MGTGCVLFTARPVVLSFSHFSIKIIFRFFDLYIFYLISFLLERLNVAVLLIYFKGFSLNNLYIIWVSPLSNNTPFPGNIFNFLIIYFSKPVLIQFQHSILSRILWGALVMKLWLCTKYPTLVKILIQSLPSRVLLPTHPRGSISVFYVLLLLFQILLLFMSVQFSLSSSFFWGNFFHFSFSTFSLSSFLISIIKITIYFQCLFLLLFCDRF